MDSTLRTPITSPREETSSPHPTASSSSPSLYHQHRALGATTQGSLAHLLPTAASQIRLSNITPTSASKSDQTTSPKQYEKLKRQPTLQSRVLIHEEIAGVINALRKYLRWNSGYSSSRRSSPAIASVDPVHIQHLNAMLPSLLSTGRILGNVEHGENKAESLSSPHPNGLSRVLQLTCEPGAVHFHATHHHTNSSFTSSSLSNTMSSSTDHPIISRFNHLCSILEWTPEGEFIDPADLVGPFLEIIKSGDTSGSITGIALSSLEKFIQHGCFDMDHPNMQRALLMMSHAVTRCRFEASDSLSSDEVVLDKLLALIQTIVLYKGLEMMIDDKGICEMLEVAFGIFFQNRASELLRHSAERALTSLVSVVFARLPILWGLMSRVPQVIPQVEGDEGYLSDSPSVNLGTEESSDQPPYSSRPSIERIHKPSLRLIDEDTKRSHASLPTIISVSLDTSIEQQPAPGPLAPAQSSLLLPMIEESQNGAEVISSALSAGGSVAVITDLPANVAKADSILIHEEQFERTRNMESTMIDVHEQKTMSPGATHEYPIVDSAHVESMGGIRHFGMPSILELIRVLNALIDVKNNQHTDGLHRQLAIKLCDVAIENCGEALGDWIALGSRIKGTPEASLTPDEKSALAFVELMNDLLKHLFQVLEICPITVQNQPTPVTLQLVYSSLRAIVVIFTATDHYKLPQEWMIQWIIRKLETGIITWDVEGKFMGAEQLMIKPSAFAASTSSLAAQSLAPTRGEIVVGDVRELMLKALLQLSRSPKFMANLYYNYDGGEKVQSHLYEELIMFLARNSFPDATPGGSVTSSIHQGLCLDALLMFLNRLDPNQQASEDDLKGIQAIRNIKQIKRIHLKGAQLFNSKPKEGIAFLQENGVLPVPIDPSSIANFLSNSAIVDKKLLGEYLSKPANVDILKAFVALYDFKGKRIDEGLRLLLESFRLPGESQQIEKIMETFAYYYFRATQEQHEIETQDAAFILAYSLIMLNTDQHNPQVRRRMTLQDFIKNNRGINSGKNFSPDYLQQVFNAIKENEIVMPEEHEGSLGFHYKWNQVMKGALVAGPLKSCPVFVDRELFFLSWPAAVAAISYAFDNAEDNLVLQKAVIGLHRCAVFAAKNGITGAVDSIITSLSKISGISKGSNSSDGAKGRRWILAFGRNYRSKIAASLSFSLAAEFPQNLLDGWTTVLDDIASIFVNDMLSDDFLDWIASGRSHAQLSVSSAIPKFSVTPAEVAQPNSKKEINLFSTLSHFLSLSAAGNNDDDHEDGGVGYRPGDVEAMERTVAQFFASSPLQQILDVSRVNEATAMHVIQVLMKASKFGESATSPGADESFAATSSADANRPTKYKECCVFNLELMTKFVINEASWDLVFEHIKEFSDDFLLTIRSPGAVFEHVMHCVFKLLSTPNLTRERQLQCLQYLSAVPNQRIALAPVTFARGLSASMSYLELKDELWKPFHSLLAAICTMPETSAIGFGVLLLLIADTEHALTPENFGDVVDLLIINSGGGQSPGANERAVMSLERLYALHERIPALTERSGMQPKRAWFEFWLPILSGLGQQCYHPLKEVRQHAFAYLQRALLSPELEASATNASVETWVQCFDNVLFPLLDELLQNEIFKMDKSGTDETRLGACSLLCKIFLQFLPRLESYAELDLLWVKLLEYLKKFMLKNETKGVLYEGVLESLKNLLLVMSTHSSFQNHEAAEFGPVHLWGPTWDVLNPILPTLKDDLFPPLPPADA